jgi:hypothetical protein
MDKPGRRIQRGGFLILMGLTAAFIGTAGGLAWYTTHRVTQADKSSRDRLIDRIVANQPFSQQEEDDAVQSMGRSARLLAGAAGMLGAVTNIGPVDTGTAIAVGADVAIGKMIEHGIENPGAPRQSAPLPADVRMPAACTSAAVVFCTTRATCVAARGHWWSDNTCRTKPQPACTGTQLNHCLTDAACRGAGGTWIDNLCTRPGCWQLVEGRPYKEPISTGYGGSSTAVGNLVDRQSYPANPQWSHLVTAVHFTWSFANADPSTGDPQLLCPGETLAGTGTMQNTGNQLTRSGYVPNAYVTMYVGSGGGTAVWALSSADLPEPGKSVTRPFPPSIKVPPGAANQMLRIECAGYAGGLSSYNYHFRMVPPR